MPVRAQCEDCRWYRGGECTRYTPVYDGLACHLFEHPVSVKDKNVMSCPPETVDDFEMPEPQRPEPELDILTETPDPTSTMFFERIRGWLLFFLIVYVGLGMVRTVIATAQVFREGDIMVSLCELLVCALFVSTGALTILAFRRRDPDAVFLAKIFVALCFIANVITLASGDNTHAATRGAVLGIIWSVIWYLYLERSELVKRLIPPAYRKTTKRGKAIIIAAAAVLLSAFGYGFYLGITEAHRTGDDGSNDVAALTGIGTEAVDTDAEVFSDGNIVFSVAYGIRCTEGYLDEGDKYFSLEDPVAESSMLILSGEESDTSKRTFLKYWDAWKPDDFETYDYKVLDDGINVEDDLKVRYRTVRVYHDDGPNVDWEYYMIYHLPSGKVCMISAYGNDEEGHSQMLDMLLDIKFVDD